MYKQDRVTAEYIAKLHEDHKWPHVVKATAGKNQPDRIIETASILKGSWIIGSAVQSTDQEVLKNIKRGNISSDAYRMFIEYANKQSTSAQSYTEIILALPGDTMEKHFNSMRSGIENQVSTLRMYQAMLLHGTNMASQETRKEFKLLTKFRILPGCIGRYQFGDQAVPVAEVDDLYDTREEAEQFALEASNLDKFLAGELGKNELLEHRALMYLELQDIADVLLKCLQDILLNEGFWNDRLEEYFKQLIRFTVCKKRRIDNTADTIVEPFNYDFKNLSEHNFCTDPRKIEYSVQRVELSFFHTPDQKRHINNAVELYKHSPGGVGKMIQCSNLKMMYRQTGYVN